MKIKFEDYEITFEKHSAVVSEIMLYHYEVFFKGIMIYPTSLQEDPEIARREAEEEAKNFLILSKRLKV